MTVKQEGMTIEQLLKPRYKVIADWPDSHFPVGYIIRFNDTSRKGNPIYYYAEYDGMVALEQAYFDDYPHLFKRLEWWEELEEKDMPKYLKWPDNGTFTEVHSYDIPNGVFYDSDGSGFLYQLTHTLPATKEEFDAFKTK